MPAAGDKDSEGSTLVLGLTVPATGPLREIAGEIATRVAEHLGAEGPDAQSVGARLEAIVADLGAAPAQQGKDITFEFRRAGAELVIHVHCAGRASEVRHPLPA